MGEVVEAEFFSVANWNIFASRARTKSAMDKWMPRLDSVCQKGVEIPFTEF